MLNLVEIELEGFRSFKKRTLVPLSESGSTLISGLYVDGTTGSGVGKSSIPIAIAFALGFCDLPSTLLKNWDSKKMSVRLRIKDETNVYDIIRDPKLKLLENGNLYESMSKGTEERLEEILKTSPELISDLTYRQQRKHGKYLNSTDSDKKEFLSSLIGLTELEEASDSLVKELNLGQNNLDASHMEINRMKSNMEMLQDAPESLEKAKKIFADAQERLNSFTLNSDKENLAIEIQSLKNSIAQLNQTISQSNYAKMENQSIRTQVIKIQEEIEVLRASICPTCRREWDSGQGKLEALNSSKLNYLNKMKTNIGLIESAQSAESSLPLMVSRLEELTRKVGELNGPIVDAQNSFDTAKRYLTEITRKCNAYEAAVKACQTETERNKVLAEEVQILLHASRLISRNGFLSVIFDEVLREIEFRANDMIARVPNVCQFALSINSVSVTKTGKTNKTISTKVIKNGEEIEIKSLSGGQQCSLELCTDLAVREAIKARSGSPIGWIILDEAMDGLDVETKKMVLEMVKEKVTGAVVVIDHASEIKESFANVIELEYDGKETNIKV